jgi:hypothetical protein
VLGFIIDALAPTFGASKNFPQALKVAVYSYTPGWVAGILAILPLLGLLAIIGALYGIYLLYLGLPRLMKNPEDKTVPYTVVTIVGAIVVWVVIAMIGGAIATPAMTVGGMGAAAARSHARADPSTPLGKLEDFGKKMEEAGKKMEAAEKSGDPNKQAEAAMAALGTALGGGKRVEPLQLEQIKPFVPEPSRGSPRPTRARSARAPPAS